MTSCGSDQWMKSLLSMRAAACFQYIVPSGPSIQHLP
jgi:hypothetical protein